MGKIVQFPHHAFDGAGNQLVRIGIFHIVFFVCLLSVAIQGSILPFLARKLDLIDEYSDVLKTFNDYQNESAITLSKTFVGENHPWVNKQLKDIKLDNNSLVLLIQRNGCKIVPKGDVQILQNDLILLGTTVTHSSSDIKLREMEITDKHEWKNKKIKDIEFQPDFLIALIKRNKTSFVPNGDTILLEGDIVVFYMAS